MHVVIDIVKLGALGRRQRAGPGLCALDRHRSRPHDV